MSTGWQNDPSVQSWLYTAEPHPDQPGEWKSTPAEQDITAPIEDVDHLDDDNYSYAPHEETQVIEFEDIEDDPSGGNVYPTVAVTRSTPPPTPPARGQRRWLLIVGASVGVVVVAVLVIAFSVKALVGGGGGEGIPDPVAAMDTPDPFSDAVECPSTSEGSTTTGRDPGDLTSGPNVIKAFNYAYFHWRSGPAARAMTSSNVQGIGSAVDLQSSIDTLNPQARYCLSIDETGANSYRVEVTLILPDGTPDPDPDVQNITTTPIGERIYIASVTRNKK
ncbi:MULTISPECIES: hypothetical protein [Gordonia]|uniref:hypothetical protein n=1 Tax=Gordonia TaxID=2053 RepID=UPI0012BB395A|nr:hypothetical protein [Gordonia sp. 135]QGP90671.1 hypothetical protein GKZ92_23480 [Gordonia sp. 135]